MTEPGTPRSPVRQEVATELQRVVDRWRQLPLDHALSYAGRVRALVQSLADAVAMGDGMGDAMRDGMGNGMANGAPAPSVPAVPDLGPATLMDQLTVLVHDASAAAVTPTLAEDLANLRRELR